VGSCARRPDPRDREYERWDIALRDAIEGIILTFTGYGYRRVTRHLNREGWGVNHKRVLRIMRKGKLLCKARRRWKATTDSVHSEPVYPNLIKDLTADSLNRVWVADRCTTRGGCTRLLAICHQRNTKTSSSQAQMYDECPPKRIQTGLKR